MPKTPTQPAITLIREGDGPWATITGADVPEPPDDCESQQVMEWATVLSFFRIDPAKCPLHVKLRVASTYAERWGIPIDG